MGMRQQPKMHWWACLWPGFPHLWNRGSWAGLALALGFTVLLNVLLVATLVWTEWMSSGARQIGLGVLAVIWSFAWLESRADWRRYLADRRAMDLADQRTVGAVTIKAADSMGSMGTDGPEIQGPGDQSDQLYRAAQQQYLAGDWLRCEQLLMQLLKLDKRDIEARLLLATLWRHLGRTEEAARQLQRLERLEAAAPWSYEIAQELAIIACQFDRSAIDCAIDKMPPLTGSGTIASGTIDEQPAQGEQQQQTDGQSPLAA